MRNVKVGGMTGSSLDDLHCDSAYMQPLLFRQNQLIALWPNRRPTFA
jgi:hypothetical protein